MQSYIKCCDASMHVRKESYDRNFIKSILNIHDIKYTNTAVCIRVSDREETFDQGHVHTLQIFPQAV